MNREPVAVRLVHRWVRLYTRGVPADERDRRRLELESDLWEHTNDPAEKVSSRSVIGRCLRGLPADVSWRVHTLVDARRGRRSHEVGVAPRTGWWKPTTLVISITLGVLAVVGLGFGDTEDGGLLMAIGWLVPAVVLLAGLARSGRHPVSGSQTVIVGAALMALGDPILIPFAVLIVLGGLWTGNLATSSHHEGPLVVQHRQAAMTERWYVWLLVAAGLGLFGFAVLLVWPAVTPDQCTEAHPCWQDSAAWASWILSWMAALVTGGIGVILGVLRVLARRRSRTG